MLRQFEKALQLYDRILDITPNDPDVMAAKAGIYQAKGKLLEAARFLSEINWQTASEETLAIKAGHLKLNEITQRAFDYCGQKQLGFTKRCGPPLVTGRWFPTFRVTLLPGFTHYLH